MDKNKSFRRIRKFKAFHKRIHKENAKKELKPPKERKESKESTTPPKELSSFYKPFKWDGEFLDGDRLIRKTEQFHVEQGKPRNESRRIGDLFLEYCLDVEGIGNFKITSKAMEWRKT